MDETHEVRRESSAGTLNFEHDGSTVIGWTSPSSGSYNFLNLPGGADHVEPNEAAHLAFGPNTGTPRPLETP